jgi:hypothetical protein
MSQPGESEAVARWVRLAGVGMLAVVVGLTGYRVVRTYHTPSREDFSRHGMIDFHHGVYFPARALGEGVSPYSEAYVQRYPLRRPMALYSPAAPLVFFPLGLLEVRAASGLYFGMSVCLTVVLAAWALCASSIRINIATVAWAAAIVVVSRPGHINLVLGQITLPLVLGAWAACEWGASRPRLAGMGLALASLKPTFGIPLLWLTFLRGDRRAALWGAGLSLAAAGITLGLLVSREGFEQVLQGIRFAASFVETSSETVPTETWTRIDGMVLLSRLAGRNPTPLATATLATLVLVLGGWIVARLAKRERADPHGPHGLNSPSALAVWVVTLVCVYHNFYDALLLLASWCVLVVGCCRWRHGSRREVSDRGDAKFELAPSGWMAVGRAKRWALVGLLAVPAMNYASTRSFLERFQITQPLEGCVTAANSVALWLALGVLLAMALPQSMRREAVSASD